MKKIPRPTCRTCIYWDPTESCPDVGLCKFDSPSTQNPVDRHHANFCGQHQDFGTYEAAVRIAGLKCISCKNLIYVKKREKANPEFLGKCKLTRIRMFEQDGGCYLHEKI